MISKLESGARRGLRSCCTALVLTLSVAHASIAADRDTEAWTWSGKATEEVAAALRRSLPIDDDLRGSAQRFRWQVVVKADDGFGLTWMAVLRRRWDSTVEGAMLELPSGNLSYQLYRARLRNRRLSPKEAIGSLVVNRCGVGFNLCEQVAGVADALEDLQVSALPDNSLVMDPPMYSVELRTAHGGEREFSVYAWEGPVSRWCEDLRAALASCEGPNQPMHPPGEKPARG